MSILRMIGVAAVLVIVGVATVHSTKPVWYLQAMYPLKYPNIIRTHAANYDLPPDLVAAVIMQESRFDHTARSSAGATGLMQLTAQTADGIALRTGGHAFRQSDLLDPELNVRYGCWYLSHLHDKYDTGADYDLALAAYNAGQGNVDRWRKRYPDGKLVVSEIPFQETRDYVRRVNQMREYYRKAYPELMEPAKQAEGRKA